MGWLCFVRCDDRISRDSETAFTDDRDVWISLRTRSKTSSRFRAPGRINERLPILDVGVLIPLSRSYTYRVSILESMQNLISSRSVHCNQKVLYPHFRSPYVNSTRD